MKNFFRHRTVLRLVWTGLFGLVLISGMTAAYGPAGGEGKERSEAIKEEAQALIDAMGSELKRLAFDIWRAAELALEEEESSRFLAEALEKQGFRIERGLGGLSMAFAAVYGEGRPVIGILGEFDALPGLSQQAGEPTQKPITKGAPGHGWGHNLFGTGSAAAAMALKTVMEKNNLSGTVKFFGCPAEETVEGKVYMARDGAFDGLDVCLDWHPSSKNRVSLKTSNALNNFEVRFTGKTSHAAGDPWNGRSALDAIELLNHGINCLREHVRPTVRMHYVIPEGGMAPNVVPDHARGWYYVRGKDRVEVEEVYVRVKKIVEGAALMTDTNPHITIHTGVYNYLKNRRLAGLLFDNLNAVGPPPFSEKDQKFARKMQRELGREEEGMSTAIEPFEEPGGYSGGGSTDAADVSWLVPTASVNVACWPLNTPGHSWCVTASVGASPGFTGMLTAAKVLAGAAIDCLLDPAVVKEARAEFKESTKDFVYKAAIPKGQPPRKGGAKESR